MIQEKIERLREYLEKRIVGLIIAGFLLFVATRILKYFILDILPAGARAPYIEHAPSLIGIIVFILSIFVVIYCYRISFKLKRREKIILIFLVTMLLHVSVLFVYAPIWYDAQGYYDLGVLGAEKGPVYFINNYHTIADTYDDTIKANIETCLKKLYIYEWGKNKLGLQGTGDPVYQIARLHPPAWMLILSFFIFIFGKTHFSALLAEWLISALLPVAIYFLLEKYTNERAAIQTTFLFISIPTFLRITSAPLIDAPLALLITISIYFFLDSLEGENRYRSLILSGIFYSLALVTKFESLIVYLPFLILAIIKKGKFGWIKPYGIFLVSSMIVPFLLTFLNYYVFLNVITARASQDTYVSSYLSATHPFFICIMPLNLLLPFGIPILVLLLLGILRLFAVKKLSWTDQFSIVFLFTFIMVGTVLIGSTLDRHLLPFLVPLLVIVAKELQNLKVSDTFIGFSIFICAMQMLAYILSTVAAA